MEAAADYYAILGVAPGADPAAIRLAYRNLMRRYHPDVNRSEEAALKATTINEAYACLGDPDERAVYDHLRQPRPARPTFNPAPGAAPTPRPHRSTWQHQHAYMAEIHAEPPPTRWKVISLGLAAVVTLITFKITSEVTGVVMPPPEPAVFHTTMVEPSTAEGDAPCRSEPTHAQRRCESPNGEARLPAGARP